MNENFEKTAKQAAAFQEIWAESMARMMPAAFSMTPNSAPPEVLHVNACGTVARPTAGGGLWLQGKELGQPVQYVLV